MSSCFHRLISLFVAVIAAFVASCTAVPSIPRQKTVHIPHQALTDALQFDIESQNTDTPVDWISLLAFLAATYGNDFSGYQKSDLQAIRNRFTNGESMETLKFSPDYYETFSSVLKAYAGPFYCQSKNPIDSDSPLWNAGYGLRAFFPIAEGFRYFYDNNPKSSGHRLFCNDGTPIIAIEGGTIKKSPRTTAAVNISASGALIKNVIMTMYTYAKTHFRRILCSKAPWCLPEM